jgi:hypothetical protein
MKKAIVLPLSFAVFYADTIAAITALPLLGSAVAAATNDTPLALAGALAIAGPTAACAAVELRRARGHLIDLSMNLLDRTDPANATQSWRDCEDCDSDFGLCDQHARDDDRRNTVKPHPSEGLVHYETSPQPASSEDDAA